MTRLQLIVFLVLMIGTAICAVHAQPASGTTAVKRVDVDKYAKLFADTNNVVLDVRSPAEFEKGHIPRAINIDINGSKFQDKIAALDKNKTYLVNCAVGMRSARACKKMEGMGFKNLYDLGVGFDGWKKAGKPVER